MRTDTPQPIRLADYTPPAFLIDETHLTFLLDPNHTRVKAKLTIRRNGDHDQPLKLNGERLKPVSVALDGRELQGAEPTLEVRSQFDAVRGREDFKAILAAAHEGRERSLAAFRDAGGERLLGRR